MAFHLTHPDRNDVHVETTGRRDALLARGYSEVKKAEPKAPAKKAPAKQDD